MGEIPGSRYFISQGTFYEISDATRVIEAYKWDRGYQIKLQIVGHDDTNSVLKDTPSYKMNPNKNDVPGKARTVTYLLDKVRGRTEDEIPTEPGFCFIGGFLPSRAAAPENILVQFVLHGKADVSFDLNTNSDIRQTTTLLERGNDIDAALNQSEGRTIRKGPVELHGMQAEEWLMAGLTQLRIPGHHMTLEANSMISSAPTPLVTLDMDTGSNSKLLLDRVEKASLTEGEAVALWDAVSRTLRPRQNGF